MDLSWTFNLPMEEIRTIKLLIKENEADTPVDWEDSRAIHHPIFGLVTHETWSYVARLLGHEGIFSNWKKEGF